MNWQRFKFFFPLLLMLLVGCERYYLGVKRASVGGETLASRFVGSPDPRLKDPPVGQKLFVEWNLARKQDVTLKLYLLFKDYSQETVVYEIGERRGIYVYSLMGGKFLEKGGLMTYKAELVKEDKVIKTWEQQLWTKLIEIEEDQFDLEQSSVE